MSSSFVMHLKEKIFFIFLYYNPFWKVSNKSEIKNIMLTASLQYNNVLLHCKQTEA